MRGIHTRLAIQTALRILNSSKARPVVSLLARSHNCGARRCCVELGGDQIRVSTQRARGSTARVLKSCLRKNLLDLLGAPIRETGRRRSPVADLVEDGCGEAPGFYKGWGARPPTLGFCWRLSPPPFRVALCPSWPALSPAGNRGCCARERDCLSQSRNGCVPIFVRAPSSEIQPPLRDRRVGSPSNDLPGCRSTQFSWRRETPLVSHCETPELSVSASQRGLLVWPSQIAHCPGRQKEEPRSISQKVWNIKNSFLSNTG